MKSWETLEADVNVWMNKHFTPGRPSGIQYVVIHHNGGNLTTQQCWNVWQTRQASAHYQVERSGRIGQLVHDRDQAWHAGNTAANRVSIGIEHANQTFAPSWTVSDATLDNGAHLVAALCKVYKLGAPVWMKTVFPHRHFKATDCPGALYSTQRDAYLARAAHWYSVMTGAPSVPPAVTPPPPPPVSGLKVDGIWGAATTRAVQAMLNKRGAGIAADGWFGDKTVRALQRTLGTPQDGKISGQITAVRSFQPSWVAGIYSGTKGGSTAIRAFAAKIEASSLGTNGTAKDGLAGQGFTTALQTWLNRGEQL